MAKPDRFGRWVAPFLALAVVVILLAGLFVIRHYRSRLLARRPRIRHTQREALLERMKADPSQPWPRGVGHVVLAWPGSLLDQKGYLEPGGSFSPGVGSFGILIQAGRFTSATIPLDQIQQRMEDRDFGVQTETPYYSATWSVESPASFKLEIAPRAGLPLSLLLRSDGPAGGPLVSITQDNNGLLVNGRWRIEAADARKQALSALVITGSGDWLQAVIPLAETRTLRVIRVTPMPDPRLLPPSRGLAVLESLPRVELPDARFSASMRAQAQHLLMGLVEDETRPGDPVNYPLAWARDGAYVLSALARSGEISTARTLALYYARHDYFGGFGPEADIPGQALWAIGEVADRAHDPGFDAAVWPDVYRKAEAIVRMRHTASAIYQVPFGPIVPAYLESPDLALVCEPARAGLIVGRMDWGRPALYVNGVSYAGLRAAARMARRQADGALYAERWDREASELRTAWWQAFNTPERLNERAAIIGLWPSTVASDDPVRYSSVLQEQWDRTHLPDGNFKTRPLWTYFKAAEAHEWLLEESAGVSSGRERAWKMLEWFWANQTSPGLYTWWEGDGEENSFGQWQDIRGWVKRSPVTPHYWTAAEILALQLDMLVHEDTDGNLTIGLGVLDAWLAHPMRVSGIACTRGTVAWNWDGHHLQVLLNGRPTPFTPGPAFRASISSLRSSSPAEP